MFLTHPIWKELLCCFLPTNHSTWSSPTSNFFQQVSYIIRDFLYNVRFWQEGLLAAPVCSCLACAGAAVLSPCDDVLNQLPCTLQTRRPRREFSKGRNLLIIPCFERAFALIFGTLVLFPLNYRASKNFMVVYFVLNALRSINRFQKLFAEACDEMSAVQAMG